MEGSGTRYSGQTARRVAPAPSEGSALFPGPSLWDLPHTPQSAVAA